MPLFPLSMVVLPGEELKLHIFEPRYKQMFFDIKTNNISFGIPPYLEGKSLKYGTELELIEIVKQYEDGKLDIKAKAIGWFEISAFYKIMPGKLYPGGEVKRMPWSDEGDFLLNIKLVDLIKELYEIMKIHNVFVQSPENFKTYQLIHKVGMDIDQELHMLTLHDETDKQIYMISHLESLLPVVRQAEELRKRAELNGHFQNVIPPKL